MTYINRPTFHQVRFTIKVEISGVIRRHTIQKHLALIILLHAIEVPIDNIVCISFLHFWHEGMRRDAHNFLIFYFHSFVKICESHWLSEL